METRARYLLVGILVLAATLAGFAFVYWLHTGSGLAAETIVRVRFAGSVSGIRRGSSVLFDGMRVGEVRDVMLDRTDPRQVTMLLAVSPDTPLRRDTSVGIETQSLMGTPTVSLRGGAADAPPLASSQGDPPTLVADASASLGTMETVRALATRIDRVVADNAGNLKTTIDNITVFSGALARNSERIDAVMEGLARMTGAATPKPAPLYDLAAPEGAMPRTLPTAQLAIDEPSAPIALDSQRILEEDGRALKPLSDALWADNLPKLVQARLIESFEKVGYGRTIPAVEGIASDMRLHVDLRRFFLTLKPEATAEVEISAKLIDSSGRVVAIRRFAAKAPAGTLDADKVSAAFSAAFGRVVGELVPWTFQGLEASSSVGR
jgi:phospholipid/cholesterol/gamma-HCH transport system substrate-binding protein